MMIGSEAKLWGPVRALMALRRRTILHAHCSLPFYVNQSVLQSNRLSLRVSLTIRLSWRMNPMYLDTRTQQFCLAAGASWLVLGQPYILLTREVTPVSTRLTAPVWQLRCLLLMRSTRCWSSSAAREFVVDFIRPVGKKDACHFCRILVMTLSRSYRERSFSSISFSVPVQLWTTHCHVM